MLQTRTESQQFWGIITNKIDLFQVIFLAMYSYVMEIMSKK